MQGSSWVYELLDHRRSFAYKTIYIYMYKTLYRSVYASMLKFGTTSHADLIQDVWCFLTDVLYKSQRPIKMGLILIYYFMAFFSCTFLLGEQRQYQLIPTKACSSVSQNFLENWGRLELLPSNFSGKFCSFGVPYRLYFCMFFFQSKPYLQANA